jgi:hypothetical protein
LDGIISEDKWSIGAKKVSIIKAILTNDKGEYNMLNLVGNDNLNIQSLMFRWVHNFRCFSCPRKFTLGRAIGMWCLFGVEFPPFEYLTINGRRISNYEYNVETVDYWPWNQMFIIETH